MRPRLLVGAIPALRTCWTPREVSLTGGNVVMAQAMASSSAMAKTGRSASAVRREVADVIVLADTAKDPPMAAIAVQTSAAPPRLLTERERMPPVAAADMNRATLKQRRHPRASAVGRGIAIVH